VPGRELSARQQVESTAGPAAHQEVVWDMVLPVESAVPQRRGALRSLSQLISAIDDTIAKNPQKMFGIKLMFALCLGIIVQ
jgi:hypothetical protein